MTRPGMGSVAGTTRSFAARTWLRVLATILRLGLAALWLAAGLAKVGDANGMVRSVRAFRLLPEALVHPVAYAVPFVEIALGVLLVLGLATRACAAVSALLLAAYIVAIASAAARGLRIECGCFSQGGDLAKGAPTHYTSELLRDSALLVASVLLALLPAGFLALDRALFGPPAAPGRRARDGDAFDEEAGLDETDRPRRGDGAAPRAAGWGTGGARGGTEPRAGGDRTHPGDGATRRRRDG